MSVDKNKKPKKKAPAKKKPAAKRKSTKKPAKKRATKKVKKDIEKAVDHIPGIIAEHIEFDTPKKKKAPKKKVAADVDKTLAELKPSNAAKLERPALRQTRQYVDRSHKRKTSVLWLGVISLTLIVFVMWFWNTRSVILDIRASDSQEQAIWETARQDLRTIMTEIVSPERDEISDAVEAARPDTTLTESLRDALAGLFVTATSTSSTESLIVATSTDQIATSTTTTISTITTSTEQ